MSRHRNVRNIDLDDYMDEDDGYDDDDYYDEPYEEEEEYAPQPKSSAAAPASKSAPAPSAAPSRPAATTSALSADEKVRLDSGVDYIQSVIGDMGLSYQTMADTLRHFDYDAEAALGYLLDNGKAPVPAQAQAPAAAAAAAAPPRLEYTAAKNVSASPAPPQTDDDVQSKQKGAFERDRKGQLHKVHKPGHLDKDLAAHAKAHDADNEPLSQLGYDLSAMGFDVPKDQARSASPKPQPTPKIDKPRKNVIDVKSEYAKRVENEKEMIRLVVVGHVDAGKSTLMGHMLYLVGRVDARTMNKYERESQKVGKGSFAFAWVLDETGEERERGITMDIAETHFETSTKYVTLLDAPGHKDFIPNMITGAAQADVAILVVNATNNEFETGFEAGGQTREHALLIRSLGVTQLIVAVNKLDTVDWSQARYDEIKAKLEPFLKQVGFKAKDIQYVPCSGLTGANLTEDKESRLQAWYKGGTLLQAIDNLKAPERALDLPLRMSVTDIFKSLVGGATIACTIVCGHTQVGDRIMLMPGAEIGTIKGLEVNGLPAKWGVAGDHISITTNNIDLAHVNIGNFFCDPEKPIRLVSRFRAQIVVFHITVPITKGFPAVVHYQMVNEPGYITKLVSILNKTTGEVLKNKPRVLTKNTTAIVEVTMHRPVCLEEYKDFKGLGRFMLRDKGSTIAAGIVLEVKDAPKEVPLSRTPQPQV